MPSNIEIDNLQQQYPEMRIWGVDGNKYHDSSRLGDITVVPFYDVIDALRACEQRVTDQVNREWAEISVDDEVRIWNEAIDAAREALSNWFTQTRDEMYWSDANAVIDSLERLNTTDCLCPTPNPDCQHPTCPRSENE